MEKTKNINNFDYQTIEIKKEKQDEIVKIYECLGWSLRKISQHKQYDNLVDVEFERDHFIGSKDDLQFLQVGVESDVNNLGRIERTRKLRAVSLIIALCILSVGALAGAVFLFINAKEVGLVWSILMLMVAVVFSGLTIMAEKRIAQKEKKLVAEKTLQYKKSIEHQLQSAKILLGGKDGKET